MAGYIGSQTPVVSNGSQRKYTFTATAAQTVFTGMDIPNPQQIQVFQNGVRLVITTDYTVSSGTTVTLVNAASAGDSLVVILFADYQLLDTDALTFTGGTTIEGDLTVDTNTLYVDSTNNRVGIGTSSPSYKLDISGVVQSSGSFNPNNSGWNNAAFRGQGSYGGGLAFIDGSSGYGIWAQDAGGTLAIGQGGTGGALTERMRLDSSGNLLVGKTTSALATAGTAIRGDNAGLINSARAGTILELNRLTSDGSIIDFYKDGSTVGSINARSGDLLIGTGDVGLRFDTGASSYIPFNVTTSSGRDDAIDLGSSSVRFDDVYATNGSIQTSDQNEKQQIASLTDAEITAAKAISKLFKTFKWNDSVAEKGDAARTHSGVIAQEVEQAMTDAGLNAGDYAFFINTTWWETQTDVPAVEADEENGVEAQEAYTRTDTYDTAEEAPEGATERNRKGIRYPQLLSFIGAATEQRLASIESRLDALEGN